jgi:hypothetical protein
MKEYDKWCHISPISLRLIKYAEHWGFDKGQRLKLVDVLNEDIEGRKFFDLNIDLALKGYELRLYEGKSKYKVGMGLDRIKAYSYYELIPTELLKENELLRNEMHHITKKSSLFIEQLRDENEMLKTKQRKKSGPQSIDDKDLVKLLYKEYLNGKSLGEISSILNSSDYKTKRGGKWQRSTIKWILNSHEYVGRGYISEEAYQSVQETLKKRRRNQGS